MKIKDARVLKDAEIKSKIAELRKELIKHNAQVATGTTLKSPGQLKQAKKAIARLLTVLRERKV